MKDKRRVKLATEAYNELKQIVYEIYEPDHTDDHHEVYPIWAAMSKLAYALGQPTPSHFIAWLDSVPTDDSAEFEDAGDYAADGEGQTMRPVEVTVRYAYLGEDT